MFASSLVFNQYFFLRILVLKNNHFWKIVKMGPPPVVTGLSPNEGPPGTRIKIRGEHLGNSPQDLIGLKICGIDCLLTAEWKSPTKVVAISGPIKGKGWY